MASLVSSSNFKVGIIGAGVVGLSAAAKIKELVGNHVDITIIAEKFGKDTTTGGCGGLWEPYNLGNTPSSDIDIWGQATYDYFIKLCCGKDAGRSGCQMITSYTFFEYPMENPPTWSHIPSNFTMLTIDDIRKLNIPDRYVAGYSYLTVVADQSYYLPYLRSQLDNLDIKFEERIVSSLEDESGYDVLINCTGMGASTLLGDNEMHPIRGQILKVKAPWMKHVWNFEPSNHYIIPLLDYVVLGGTSQKGDDNEHVEISDTEHILDGLCEIYPSLRDAPVVCEPNMFLIIGVRLSCLS